ncbi:hypothetical protein EWM64_g7088 [Hericium alpestre]|uniref:Uncharacterized protein n=1 Tax=Hericium alpestre TaxID=135208 RepID=A0A4Y9ZRN1_9AGAM|nr:hypothetical protein EWM64_g7088 [Hericium alpestre]
MPPPPSSERALNAILPLIAAGQPYEAHQKARTFASRYQKSGHFDTAIDVLFQSARELLKTGQENPYQKKAEVGRHALLYGLTLTKPGHEGRMTQLIALTSSQGSWRKTIMDKSIAWSAKHGPYPVGDPDLHHYVGELLYKDGILDGAEHHLLASGKRDSARLLAQVYHDWALSSGSLSSHAGAFALRGTIPYAGPTYLLNGNILASRTFLDSYLSHLPLSQSPLVHRTADADTTPR